jgi:primase-like protein
MHGPLLEPDHDQIEQFVDLVFRHAKMEGFVSLRAFYQEGDKPFHFTLVDLGKLGCHGIVKAAIEDARRAAQAPRPINFCPPLAVFSNRKHAREEDITQGLAISVEADSQPKAARVRLEAILGSATVVIESGGLWTDPATGEAEPKLHLHWRLRKPATTEDDLAKLKQARTLACTIVGGDPSNNPINHPIRWPGSWHRKAEPRLARIVAGDKERDIDLDHALTLLMEAAPEIESHRQSHESGDPQTDPKLAAIAVALIPNDFDDEAESWNEWNRIGMAIYRATGGSDKGLEIFHDYSKKSKQGRYNTRNTDARWESYHRSPPTKIGAGSLFHLAYNVDKHWRDEYDRAVEARFSVPPKAKEKVSEGSLVTPRS